VRRWTATATGIDCVVTATLKCPEGVFPMQVSIQGVESAAGTDGPAGRQWKVVYDASGFVQREQARITPYGWLVNKLEITGGDYGRQFISLSSHSRDARLAAYLEYTAGRTDPFLRPITQGGQTARLAVVGTTAGLAWSPGPEFFDHTADRLFTLPGGGRPSPEQMKTFRAAWNGIGIVPAGGRLSNSPDTHIQLTFPNKSVEVRVPTEIPMSSLKNELSAARGRVIVVCSDPAVAAELDRLREAANPDEGTIMPSDDIRRRTIPWTVVRVESDLQKVTSQMPGPPGGPPGRPPGMGGPGM
jgi:hypothetical protein